MIEVEDARSFRPPPLEPPPRVIVTQAHRARGPERTGQSARGRREPRRRRDRTVSFALAGLRSSSPAGWWSMRWAGSRPRSSAAPRSAYSPARRSRAAIAGAGVIIGRELTSLFRLKNVEAIQRAAVGHRPSDIPPRMRARRSATFSRWCRAIARPGSAIEAFQRQVQPHHSAHQQIEILSRAVMQPLDRRAEAHVRTAVLRAFGITAISPTALTDAAFFLACGLRMVRGIAASYGHRPTTATTMHLLRRLVVEAGKLGAVDIASGSLAQQLGGARRRTLRHDGRRIGLRLLSHGAARHHRDGPVPADSVSRGRGSERDVDGRQRRAAAHGAAISRVVGDPRTAEVWHARNTCHDLSPIVARNHSTAAHSFVGREERGST